MKLRVSLSCLCTPQSNSNPRTIIVSFHHGVLHLDQICAVDGIIFLQQAWRVNAFGPIDKMLRVSLNKVLFFILLLPRQQN